MLRAGNSARTGGARLASPVPDPRDVDLQRGASLAMTETPLVHLGLLNKAENAALVRHVLGAVGRAIGLDEGLLADVKTAVSEACSNVVLHAYQGASGPLEVTIAVHAADLAHAAGLTVVVRDRGGGIKPHRVDEEQGVLGVGLSLIQALTDKVEFSGARGEGTEVRMSFHAAPRDGAEALPAEVHPMLDGHAPLPAGETVVAVSLGSLAAPVLGAVVAVLATRADFSLDRLADAQLITDTVAAHADGTIPGRYLNLGVDSAEGGLELRLGPLVDGGAARLVRSTTRGAIRPLEVLASSLSTERAGGAEYLTLSLLA
jgi:serine/threonine-protein kinase RsbW